MKRKKSDYEANLEDLKYRLKSIARSFNEESEKFNHLMEHMRGIDNIGMGEVLLNLSTLHMKYISILEAVNQMEKIKF